jgi:hypothetical protein
MDSHLRWGCDRRVQDQRDAVMSLRRQTQYRHLLGLVPEPPQPLRHTPIAIYHFEWIERRAERVAGLTGPDR